jgi:septum formation protein
MSGRPLVLASASPRRRELLEAAGFRPRTVAADLEDDAVRVRFLLPAALVEALAAFKAARVARLLGEAGEPEAVVLAADTLCFDADRPVGKPRDAAEAAAFLRSWRGRPHRTVTGVCVLADGRRTLFADSATVEVGDLEDAEIDRYVASGAWKGKAGGYNLAERLGAGWPIRCDGDPTSVMGLPMLRVGPLLHSLGCGTRGGPA